MDKIFALTIGFLIYGLPLLWVIYILVRYLIVQIKAYNSQTLPQKGLKPSTRIILSSFGILYGIFVFSGLIITMIKPDWFQPPFWFVVVLIIAIVPYYACIAGTIGLGYAGQAGVSPSTIANKTIKNIKNEGKIKP